jgi:ubiquinol-cytochrome c reductase iron-sulfur subunit
MTVSPARRQTHPGENRMDSISITSSHDFERRRALLAATTAVGGIAAVGVAIPFVESMEPSEAAKAAGAPVEVDIGGIQPGSLITVEWRGKPVWILHRTDAMLASLSQHDALLADPQSKQSEQPAAATNATRAIRPPFLVLIGICTHLGCVPSFRRSRWISAASSPVR